MTLPCPASPPPYPWTPRTLPPHIAQKKMEKNEKKAIQEHYFLGFCEEKESCSYISEREFERELQQKEKKALCFEINTYTEQGPARKTMEDAHFVLSNDQGLLLGLFDGHGGSAVARCAKNFFKGLFFTTLASHSGNIHQTFEYLFSLFEQHLKREDFSLSQGTTALLCLIQHHHIYTATLGDSEANLYRKVEGAKRKSIPLSVLRDWGCHKEAIRASIALQDLSIRSRWTHCDAPKSLRYSGLNVSRTFGDFQAKTKSSFGPAIIAKPKITEVPLKRGDILLLTCDGIKDFVRERQIVDALDAASPLENLAEKIGLLALRTMTQERGDNITVLSVKIEKKNTKRRIGCCLPFF